MRAALVGDGIAASLSPRLHQDEGMAQGFDYSYERIDTAEAPWTRRTLPEILDYAARAGLAGLNITHPHKTAAARLVDDLSGPAAELGSVNTVVFRGGRRLGYTTDYDGFAHLLRRAGRPAAGARVIQFGAGGAGAATALALLDEGADLTLTDLDPERGRTLLNRLRTARPGANVTFASAGDVNLSQAAGCVNATPLGMNAHPGMAFDPARLPRSAWVADIVYLPLETKLLRTARGLGLRTLNGGAMVVGQAVSAFELMTNRRADAARMHRTFEDWAEATGRRVA